MHITNAEVSIEQNEYDVTMIEFAGMAGGKAANVVMQYTPEEDAITIQHGMNTYHIQIDDPSRQSYSGVTRLLVDGGRLHFAFDAIAESVLLENELIVDIGDSDKRDELLHYLRMAFREHAQQLQETFTANEHGQRRFPSIHTAKAVLVDVVEQGVFFVALDLTSGDRLHYVGLLNEGKTAAELAEKHRLSVEWRDDWQVACLFIDGTCQAMLNFEGQRAFGAENGVHMDSSWETFTINAEAIKDLYVPRVNERPRHGAPGAADSTAEGDDSIVFPNSPLKTLSEYVTFNRMLQAGDMVGALSKFGMDMASYGTVAAEWAQKMATDPALMSRYVRRLSA